MKAIWISFLAVGILISLGPIILPEFYTELSFTSYGLVLVSFLLVVRNAKQRYAISEWRVFFRIFPESVPILIAFGLLAVYIEVPLRFDRLLDVLVCLFIGCLCWGAALFFRFVPMLITIREFLKR